MSGRAANPYLVIHNLITGYATRNQEHMWTYDKVLENSSQRLLSDTIRNWDKMRQEGVRDPSKISNALAPVKRLVVCLFGFGAGIWDTIDSAKDITYENLLDPLGDALVLTTTDQRCKFYVRWRTDCKTYEHTHGHDFQVQYMGYLVPPSATGGDVKENY